jgi:hypothetical protein
LAARARLAENAAAQLFADVLIGYASPELMILMARFVVSSNRCPVAVAS